MEKIFNRTVLMIVTGVYLLALFVGIFEKLNHFPFGDVSVSIIFYMKILFYGYLLIYGGYHLSKVSFTRNK